LAAGLVALVLALGLLTPLPTIAEEDPAVAEDSPAAPEEPQAIEEPPTAPDERPRATEGPYSQGRVRISVSAGMSNAFDAQYFAIHAGAGYFVWDGLELGLDAEQWFGSGPSLSKLSPETRYVLYFVPVITPYIGAFYKHWFVGDGLADVDTVGGRVGAFIAAFGGHAVFGGGAVFEQRISECQSDCFSVYPELTFYVTF